MQRILLLQMQRLLLVRMKKINKFKWTFILLVIILASFYLMWKTDLIWISSLVPIIGLDWVHKKCNMHFIAFKSSCMFFVQLLHSGM